jgi:putative addiction module component (TIGR02574 family)
MSLKEAIPALDTLSTREKLALIEGLWADVSQDDDALPVSPAQQRLLDSRYAEHVAAPASGTTSWSEARERILKRL